MLLKYNVLQHVTTTMCSSSLTMFNSDLTTISLTLWYSIQYTLCKNSLISQEAQSGKTNGGKRDNVVRS